MMHRRTLAGKNGNPIIAYINYFFAVDACNEMITNMQWNRYMHVPRGTQGSGCSFLI